MPAEAVWDLLQGEDERTLRAVGKVRRDVLRAAAEFAGALEAGGRVFLVGAGTSARLAAMEAAECPPTFGTHPSRVQALVAGGRGALRRAREGAEDDRPAALAALRAARIGGNDLVLGVSAGGATPFVAAALGEARRRGARTVLLACNPPRTARLPAADVRIVPVPGPEVLSGSTRMKAGTATKCILNRITLLAMVRLGKMYGNRMVDLRPGSRKLRRRALGILRDLTGLSPARARGLLVGGGGDLKTALVMGLRGLDATAAKKALRRHGGRLRAVLEEPSRLPE